MILWDYQDKGYTHYRLKVNVDTCEKCTDLNGKVFPISEAKSGMNFAPIHPNCDCSAEILDENGNAVFVVAQKTENKENDDSLEYLQASLRQIVLGNYTDDVNLVGTLGQVLARQEDGSVSCCFFPKNIKIIITKPLRRAYIST